MLNKHNIFSELIAKMKKLSSIVIGTFLFLSLTTGQSQDYWELVNSPDSVDIFDIAVDPEGRIFLACPWSTGNLTGIFRSEDNCESWQRVVQGMDTNYSPHTRSIVSDDEGILVTGENNQIYRSTDHGENWLEVYYAYPFSSSFNQAAYGYDSIFLIGGENEQGIIRSGDNGITWEQVLNFESFDPIYEEATTGICFGPEGNIYACSRTFIGGSGSVYVSEDLGFTWSVFYNNGSSQFFSIGFDQMGRLLAGSVGLYRYDFQNENWEFINYNMVPFEMLIVGDSSIYLACDEESGGFGGVAFSNDIGNTYAPLNSGMIAEDAEDFAIDASGRILVKGNYNFLYRSYDTLSTNLQTLNHTINYKSLICSPNPFKEVTSLISKVNKLTHLKIFDIMGDFILETTIEPNGIYHLSDEYLAPGIYIAILDSGNQSFMLKIIHL